MSIAVVCPSRDNPPALLEACVAFTSTRTREDSVFVAVVDDNDPRKDEYLDLFAGEGPMRILICPPESLGNMNSALNWAAVLLADEFSIIGFIGDDHRFRSAGWDAAVETALEAAGIVYGNDLFQGRNLPTQVFIRSSIVKALGWMGLPGARHLYLDDTWKTLGQRAGCLGYLDNVIIEHVHPAAGKVAWDQAHMRVNTDEMYAHDRAVYQQWLSHRAEYDIATVVEAIR